MRIHTNTVTTADVLRAIRALPGVFADVTVHGSRSHDHALELRLTGTSSRRPNPGRGGGRTSDDYAATWDEWGAVFAALYEVDPDMVCGSVKHPAYSGADDFHWQTGDRFRDFDIKNQHKNHRWEYVGDAATGAYMVHECKCGAVRRFTFGR